MDLPKDINYQLMLRMEDKDLVNFCRTSKKANEYCQDDIFWLNRIMYKFPYIPLDVLKRYKGERSWANYYIYDLRKVDIKSKNYVSLLTNAFNGRLDRVMILTNNGFRHPGALNNAATNGHLEVVKYLLSKGYIIDSSLIFAVIHGHLDIVKYLVEHGANVNIEYFDGTPLGYAYEYGLTDIANYLIEKGAKID